MLDRAMVINGICMVAALAAATMITRFLPFVIFPQGKKMPGFMEHLGKDPALCGHGTSGGVLSQGCECVGKFFTDCRSFWLWRL